MVSPIIYLSHPHFYFSDCNSESEIPTPNVDGKTLRNVINFCDLFADAPPYDPEDKTTLRMDPKVKKFMEKLSTDDFKKILLAANYLDNPRLIDAGLLKIHNELEGLVSSRFH